MSSIKDLATKALIDRISTAAKEAGQDSVVSRSEIAVFYMSQRAIRAQMLTKETAHLDIAVAAAFLEYFNSTTLVVRNRAALDKELSLEGKRARVARPFVYHEAGSADFVLIAKSQQGITKLLNPANKYVANKLKLESVLLSKNGDRSFQLGRGLQEGEASTPGLRYLKTAQAKLSKFSGGGKLLTSISSSVKKLENEYKNSGAYSLEYDQSSSMATIKGHFACSYIVPINANINSKLRAVDRKAIKEISKEISLLTGKQSLSTQMDEIIHAALWGNKVEYKTEHSSKGKAEALESKKVKRTKAQGKLKKLRIAGHRGTTNLLALTDLINEALPKRVEDNMHRPFLEYKTGRFADSTEVSYITQGRSGALTMYYTYMKYPYQTFEPGFVQGHKGYDPRPLIAKSIREIATGLVSEKFRSVRI